MDDERGVVPEPPMPTCGILPHRVLNSAASHRASFSAFLAVLIGWAVYTGVLASGYFLSLVPKHRGETAWFILVLLGGLSAALSSAAQPNATRDPAELEWRGVGLRTLAFVGLSLAIYVPSLTLGLLSDDFTLLSRASRHDFWSPSQFLRPVPLILWAVAHGAVGPNAAVLHTINVLLHGINGLLVVAVARRMSLSNRTAFAAGVLFLCFPASVEAVAWASGIQDVLLATGGLTFVLACSSRTPGYRAVWIGLVGLALALGTKETAVAAPFLAWALWFRRDYRWRALVVAGAALVVAYIVFRALVLHLDAGFVVVPSRYFVKELISRPFSTLAVPFTGAELARTPGLGIALTWFFLALFVGSALTWRTNRAQFGTVARTGAWILLSVAPVYSMFFISADLQGSRYLYLPACGWSLLVATMLLETPNARRARFGMVFVTALAVVWVVGVRLHLAEWQEASRVRDRVIAGAANRLQGTDCAVVHFLGLPDSVGGAYVFRNGFLDALRDADGLGWKARVGAGEPACTFEWREDSFKQAGPADARTTGTGSSTPFVERR